VRVALVCPYSLTVPGGVQGQVIALARSLRAIGVDARLLAPCDGPPPDSGVIPLGVSIPMAGNGSVAPIAPDAACVLRTIRALRDERFDIVHLHEPLVPGPTLTALLCSDTAIVGTFHRAGPSPMYRAMRPLSRWAVKRLALRYAVSEQALTTATDAVGGHYELVFNGIEIDRYAKAEPWPTEGPTILFVGRHEERKGLGVLLEAMKELGPEVRLWIAGQGPQTEMLYQRTLGDPRIEWLGSVSEKEKASRLRGAQVFCAPSLHGESFGVVLLEAMAALTAIVATDLPGYRNVARPGVDALLVPPGDAGALAQALVVTLAGRPPVLERVEAAEARAAGFSMDRLAQRYLDGYRRLTAA
jgi:phosphatidylinositol alpha-mannosyltransferase